MMNIWREIAEREARMAAVARREYERKIEELKPHHPPSGLRIGKTITPYARANLRPGCRGPEVEADG